MEKLHITQAVLVEGKYDKVKLEAVLDAFILPLDGFKIYHDAQMRTLVRTLAKTCGVVLLTDSDSAGFRIRGHVAGLLPANEVTHVYIPDLPGKERRKSRPSKEGKLGVEGMTVQTLREAFLRAGLLADAQAPADPITKADLYEDGLSGGTNSHTLRQRLLLRLELPERLSQNALLPVLNRLCTRKQYKELVQEIKQP